MSRVKTNSVESLVADQTPTFKDPNGREMGQPCKAWVNFNGTGTVAIRDSFNVSSITDNGTGNYTVNFTNAMANANYSVSSNATADGATTGFPHSQAISRTTTDTTLRTSEATGDVFNAIDRSAVDCTIFAND